MALSDAIALGSLVVSAIAVWISLGAKQAADRFASDRVAKRATVAKALDQFNRTIEAVRATRQQGGEIGEHDHWIQECHEEGYAAVKQADPTLLPIYNAPLTKRDPLHALEERAGRLQAILDRL